MKENNKQINLGRKFLAAPVFRYINIKISKSSFLYFRGIISLNLHRLLSPPLICTKSPIRCRQQWHPRSSSIEWCRRTSTELIYDFSLKRKREYLRGRSTSQAFSPDYLAGSGTRITIYRYQFFPGNISGTPPHSVRPPSSDIHYTSQNELGIRLRA